MTVQKQMLRLIRGMQRAAQAPRCCSSPMTLASWRRSADRMTVLYGGKVLEQGSDGARSFARPATPIRSALLAATPRYTGPEQSLKPVPDGAHRRARSAEIAA